MIALLMMLQAGWTAAPQRPTVGDTITLERLIATAPGWRVRAGRLEGYSDAQALGDPVVSQRGDGWILRYSIVAWVPGTVALEMPPFWRLGPDGTADSVPGGTATFQVASVIPDSVRSPAPQPSLGPLRWARRSPLPLLGAALLSVAALVALVALRRRRPKRVPAGATPVLDPQVSDDRWIVAGEPKAVAARAAHRLRSAIARVIPEAHEALSTSEFLAEVERQRPQGPIRELRELLIALDQVAFATAHGVEVGSLAAQSRALASEFGANGAGRGAS